MDSWNSARLREDFEEQAGLMCERESVLWRVTASCSELFGLAVLNDLHLFLLVEGHHFPEQFFFFAFFVVVEEMSGKWSTEVLPRFIKIIMTEGETTSGELAPEAGLWITKVPG